jgi:hypothetical protein
MEDNGTDVIHVVEYFFSAFFLEKDFIPEKRHVDDRFSQRFADVA